MKRTALITGASSGIGEAFADILAADGFDLVIAARREDRLRAIAARLQQTHRTRVEVIPCDLAERDAPQRLIAETDARGLTIDALVNNAGYGVPGSYVHTSWAQQDAMLQVMVIAPSALIHRLLPGMIERRYGRIINVASLAGLVPAPAGHTLYAATKAFLIKFTEALAHEATKHGVHATAVCPGFTLTEFHDVTGTRASVNTLPRWAWMDAHTVARQGVDAVMAGTPIYINGRVNRAAALLVRYLPHAVVVGAARMVAKANRKT